MKKQVTADKLIESGLAESEARELASEVNHLLENYPARECWRDLTRKWLTPDHPFPVHLYLHDVIFSDWDPNEQGPVPAPGAGRLPRGPAAQLHHVLPGARGRGLDQP